MGFVHLHNHTEYSALDGLTRVARAPKRAVELGQNAVSTTDHGDIRAGFEFQKACLEAGVKAIHGCEFYLAFGSRFEQNFETVLSDDDTVSDADEGKEKAKRYMHLTVLARTQQGFKNLIKLHNRSYELREDGASAVWYKPRIDFELLKEHGEGLIVLTGCLGGPVAGPLSRAAFLENQVKQIEGAHEKIDYYAALDRELSDEEIADKKKAENLGGMSGEADIKLQDATTLRKTARANLDTLIDAVGRENVFLEVMYHRIDAERFAYMELMKLSEETGIPMVATNDCHYEHQEESYHHDGFLAVGVKRNLDDPTRFSFNGEPTYYMRSEQEMLDVLGNHPDPDVASSWRTAVANSQMVADLCEEQTLIIPKEDEYLLPKFPLPEGYDTAEQYLHHLVGLGARRRYGDDFATARQDVVDRLTEELRVINVMGFPDYFLIVQDMVNWARSDYLAEDWVASNGGTIELPYERKTKKPILVGPGRGSAAGAAVSYVLGIVDICPLRYNLLFERFLEEGRAGMPDIDLDFERDRRHEVHQFVVIRWGKDNVAHIGSTNYALTKAAIKDAARILQPSADPEALKAASKLRFESKYAEAAKLQSQAEAEASRKASAITRLGNELAKLVPDRYSFEKLENVHDSATEKYRELVEAQWELAEPILELAKSFEGVAKAASIHPCGFIISPVPLDDVVPMRVNSDDPNDPRVITWSDKACEGMGLLKMDILGIQNLDIISKAFEGIERNQGISLSMDTLPDPDDASDETVLKAYQLLSRGDTSGVFQSESGGMRNVYRDVQPSDLNDLSAVIALFRPGPLAAGVPDLYAKRKHGMQEVDYTQFTKDPVETKWLDSVLSTTFGLFVFQEQLMRLGTVIAGFDAGQRSTLRRAVGKKKKSDMDKVGLMLEAGAEQEFYDDEGNLISPSFTKETAARFFEQAKGSAEYLFNASHSAAYAQLAFVTAYLKANWPVEYGAAILATSDKEDKRISALQDLRAAGIRVDAPDVNLSLHDTSAVGNRVVIGFKEIKNVGSVGAHIFAEREANGPFASMSDVFSRVHIPNGDGKPGVSKISTGAVQGLIESGAFDAFGPRLGQIAVMRAARETEVQPLDAEWTVLEKSARQRSLIGVTVGTHPINHHAEYLSQWRTPARDGYSQQRLGQGLKPLGAAVAQASIEEGPYYPVTGGIVAGWEEKAFSGGRRAIMQLESPSITVETMIWDKTLGELMEKKQVPRIGDLIAVSGQMKIKTTTIGNTEETGAEEGEMVETITVPSISMKSIFQIDDPEETTWDLTKPDFDVAGTFATLNEVDLPALRKAEKAALKAAEKASGSAPSVPATAPAEATQVAELPLDIEQENLVAEQPTDPEPELPEPGASENFAVPAPVATGVEARHYRWRKSTISPRLAKLTNTGDFKQFSSSTMGKGFAPGTVRYQVTPVDGIKFIIDASPAAGTDKAQRAAEIMDIIDALDVLPQGVPCEHFDGWHKFDIAEVAS